MNVRDGVTLQVKNAVTTAANCGVRSWLVTENVQISTVLSTNIELYLSSIMELANISGRWRDNFI